MSKKLPISISKEEFDKLLEFSKVERDKLWMPRAERYTPTGDRLNQYIICMVLAFGSGLRLSEIVGLKKTYTYIGKDKEGQSIKKTQVCDIDSLTAEKVENNFIRIVGGKGGKDRQVPLPAKLFKKAGITKQQFLNSLPIKASRTSIQSFTTKLGMAVLNKKISFHKYRHGFVTYALENGVDIHQVQMFAGHSRLDTTGLYLHANPKKALENYEQIEW